ncbi:MAG: FHA domain-containing protein [Spirochaetes bacterium]|nr:FHA domain-containing protein [Spirochaetota bacterium]
MNTKQKDILAIFCLFLILPVIVTAKPIITIDSIDVTSFPAINIKGIINKPESTDIGAVTKEHFTVLEDGTKVKNFELKTSIADSYIAVCVDSSKSISKKNFLKLKKIALNVISKSPEHYKFILYKFNDEVVKLGSFLENRYYYHETIETIQQHGKRTKLFNCLFTATEELARYEGKRSIILLTDGRDEGSFMLPDDIISNAREHSIPIYTIVPERCSKAAVVSRLSKITKGKLLVADAGIEHTVLNLLQGGKSSVIPFEIIFTSKKHDSAIHSIEVQFKYKTIQDNDTVHVKYAIARNTYSLTDELPFVVLAGIVVLLIMALVIVILIFINKWREIVELITMHRIPKPIQRYYSVLYEKDEMTKKEADTLLLATSPEYSYTNAWLVEKSGPETGKKFPLIWDEVTIGRDKENTIVINDDAVSLKHAKIKKIGNTYYLFDCASDNGTFLNNKKLLRPKPLSDWDEIQIGRTTILFRGTKIKH